MAAPAGTGNGRQTRMRAAGPTVERLSLYLRVLTESAADGVATVPSDELARRCGTSAAQVRKDLSLFGTFGKRGLGYSVPELVGTLRGILGLERRWRVALVGVGKIGTALLQYEDFRRQGFDILAAFDNDPARIGQDWDGVRVKPERELEASLRRQKTDIVIVAVPAEAAQAVVERVVRAGVRGILNFAPTKLQVPPHVAVKTVNMAMELQGLSYALANGAGVARSVSSRSAASRA